VPAAFGFDIQSGSVFAKKISPDLMGQTDGPQKPSLVIVTEFHLLSPRRTYPKIVPTKKGGTP
jgi:hypothetical protein